MLSAKCKTPSDIQITAEQIIREARDSFSEIFKTPNGKLIDAQELGDHLIERRKGFEDAIRCNKHNKGIWVKYAEWEASLKNFAHSRSVWERALDVDYRDHNLWLRYAEFEMKNKFINHARNVWDRAVQLLPRVDQLWYKYIHMEEMLGNIELARQIFERWMSWVPSEKGFKSYVNFELRYNETDKARSIFERLAVSHPSTSAWVKYAKFEVKLGDIGRARNCYEIALNMLGDDDDGNLFMAYADFEVMCKETERARLIYKHALSRGIFPTPTAEVLYSKFVSFEKQYGNKQSIEDAIAAKARFHYELELSKDPFNYNIWFDYIRMEEGSGLREKVEELYERAIVNKPLAIEKHLWSRYIYLWINYALYEELDVQDIKRTRDIYKLCLDTIPHKPFTFGKIWLMAAQFEIRQLNIDGARMILGKSIGVAFKHKVMKRYIELELQLGNIDRCRNLYNKYLELSPRNCYAWTKYAELEISLAETERARTLFELAVNQHELDRPELLWKAYIDFEISQSDFGKARALYERLLSRTKHIKVWISYAKFEASLKDEEKTRAVFERGLAYYKTTSPELKEERAMLSEEWLNVESSFGDLVHVDLVRSNLPKKLKKRRFVETGEGPAGYEEYIDYLFPEEAQATNLNILEAAYKWKRQKITTDDE